MTLPADRRVVDRTAYKTIVQYALQRPQSSAEGARPQSVLGVSVRASLADAMAKRSSTRLIAHDCPIPPLLRLVPASQPRPPPIHVPAIRFIVCPEFPAQSWLFIKDHKQMHAEGNH